METKTVVSFSWSETEDEAFSVTVWENASNGKRTAAKDNCFLFIINDIFAFMICEFLFFFSQRPCLYLHVDSLKAISGSRAYSTSWDVSRRL